MSSQRAVRMLIADDHTLLRDALSELLNDEANLEVVAAAGTAAETIALAARHRPDVVLLDVEMPGNDDPTATVRTLLRIASGVRILVLTMHDDPTLVQSLLASGVSGFLHKTVSHLALTAAVRSACSPGSPTTVSLAADRLLPPAPEAGPLSPREEEVIALAAQGLTNYQIARRLDIVEGTVKRHMRSIFDKLDARSRVEASNNAVARGLIPPPVPVPRRRLAATDPIREAAAPRGEGDLTNPELAGGRPGEPEHGGFRGAVRSQARYLGLRR